MNFYRAFSSALLGCLPHPSERQVRVQQSKIVNSLASHEIYRKGDMRVHENEYQDTLEIWRRKP